MPRTFAQVLKGVREQKPVKQQQKPKSVKPKSVKQQDIVSISVQKKKQQPKSRKPLSQKDLEKKIEQILKSITKNIQDLPSQFKQKKQQKK